MDYSRICVPYNEDLKPLEELLKGVRRPGDFFAHGTLEAPMPRIEVEGVGVLSFPVPTTQIQQLIQQADRAPYGRGGETILDTSVRKVWQLTPAKVRIGGKSWANTFEKVLGDVTNGLGCSDVAVSAELYKLLVYDEGSFFKAHRDTEKAEGMFGTLVVVLPSSHRGGQLRVRHAGREVVLDLSTAETSELTFAAFYADCEHEVQPIAEGNRVCLVYNLAQRRGGTGEEPLRAPLYNEQAAGAATILERAFNEEGAPAKLVWLLGHQYSPAGLSFAGLKGEDAALAKVLRQAGESAGCAVHLGIVHIEENGPAEPRYVPSRGSRYRRRYDDDVEQEDVSNDSFEVIEVSDSAHYLDQWRNTTDQVVDFGKLPLDDGEILPNGALEDEDPDEQRLMEATGNEGASFERSYHRAALVLWPRHRFADVLLQAGVGAALPFFKDRVQALAEPSSTETEREETLAIAARMIDTWEKSSPYPGYRSLGKEANRGEMIQTLHQLGDAGLLTQFIGGVLTTRYDGSENESLAASLKLLDAKTAGPLLSRLVHENMQLFPCACTELLGRLVGKMRGTARGRWLDPLQEMAGAIVEALPKLKRGLDPQDSGNWWRTKEAKPADAATVVNLLRALAALEAVPLQAAACSAMVVNTAVFDPSNVIVPALESLSKPGGGGGNEGEDSSRLWRHAVDYLLARSEHPPAPPLDWRQDRELSCKCAECSELRKFALHAVQQTYRFRVRQERRSHLENQIARHGLDMTCVTERKGSPQTLVCTKNWRTYQQQCAQHGKDLVSLGRLFQLAGNGPQSVNRCARIAAARSRAPKPPLV